MRYRSDACGTYRGYMRHYRRDGKQVDCLACTVAMNLYHQDKRLAAKRRAVLAEAVGDGSYGGRAS